MGLQNKVIFVYLTLIFAVSGAIRRGLQKSECGVYLLPAFKRPTYPNSTFCAYAPESRVGRPMGTNRAIVARDALCAPSATQLEVLLGYSRAIARFVIGVLRVIS